VEPKTYLDYFQERIAVPTELGEFVAYWSPPKGSNAPVFVFHHGFGSSGLSFALLAKRIQDLMAQTTERTAKDDDNVVAGVLAFDMRGHGQTKIDSTDFSIDTLVDDFITLMELIPDKTHWGKPSLVLAGHSLGGSVVVHAALSKRIPNVRGVVVLDAVEELATQALGGMQRLLSTWPKQFDSLGSAIDWHISTQLIRNLDSASVSVPNILSETPEGMYRWTLNLSSTEPYWSDWFKGLSSGFLRAPAARLLILAGTDRLDKELTVGQMQGKYQLVVFNDSGHYIQEDVPNKTALTVS
jgi:protein phosphatase methylesterase 1